MGFLLAWKVTSLGPGFTAPTGYEGARFAARRPCVGKTFRLVDQNKLCDEKNIKVVTGELFNAVLYAHPPP
jgi:hypothetical protein